MKNKRILPITLGLVFTMLFLLFQILVFAENSSPLALRYDFAGGDSSVLGDFKVINENADEYELKSDGLHFGRNAGDINGKRTDVQNLFLIDGLSGDYLVETHVELESAWGYPENQACLTVFDDYENFVKLGFQGTSVALCYALDGTLTNDFATVNVGSKSEMWLRIEKKDNSYTAYYSLNGENYTKVGSCDAELSAAEAGFYVGWNGYSDREPVDVWFDYFRVEALEEVAPMDKTLVPNKETVKLEHGKTFALSVESSTAGAECGELTYTSSDSSVATVSDSGVITAVGDGYATVTVNSTLSGSCRVVVSALPTLREYESVANPYMPAWEFVPDAEPYVFEDPDNPGEYRVYVYGSHDTQGDAAPCGFDQVVWSAPVDDLTRWRYDGVAFITGDYDLTANLYAPDVCEIQNADGTKTYYLYPNATSSKQYYRVAKSDRPDGPFKLCSWESDNAVDNNIISSDPAVFVDGDGRVYGYWGSSSKPLWVELDPETMATVKEGCTPRYNLPGVYDILDRNNNMQPRADYDPTLYNIVQDEHVNDWRFFEASSIRKVGNKYVFIFCRYAPDTEETGGYFSQLAYGYSDSPEGPGTYGGVIVRNAGETIPNGDGTYADTFLKQNTHGSICQIGDDWYVFYHRGHRGIISRQAMVEKISVEWDEKSVAEGGEVRIGFAEMTSKGFNTDGLDPYKTYSAGIASYLTGNYVFKADYSRDTEFLPILNIHNEVVAGIKYFNFSKNAPEGHYSTLSINLTPKGVVGSIDVYIRPTSAKGTPIVKTDGKITSVGEGSYKIGSFSVSASMPWVPTTLTLDVPEVDKLEGEWGVFLVFNTPSSYPMCDLNSIGFGVDAKEHTEEYTDNGNGTHCSSCSLCGKIMTPVEAHKFVGGSCICGAEESDEYVGSLYGYSLTVSDSVGFSFYMIIPDECLEDSGAYMSFAVNGRSRKQMLSPSRKININGVECYKFTLVLEYKELADTVTAKFVSSSGDSREYTYSVKRYAEAIMKNKAQSEEYSKAAPLLGAMLNYGANVQKYSGHSVGNLANSECAKKDVSEVTDDTLKDYRITYEQGGVLVSPAGSSLTLDPVNLKLYFSKLTDKALSFSIDGKELYAGTKDGYVYVEIEGISLERLGSDFKIAVSDGEVTEYIDYNMYTYFHFALSSNYEVFTPEFKDAIRALYLYSKAVESYK